MDKKHNGAHNELVATVWLLRQGYEVFRNVSQHGIVDIIAMKDGKMDLFDVKKAWMMANGQPSDTKLTAEQVALGVKAISVYGENDDCLIVHEPKTVYGRAELCAECGTEFVVRKARQTFCSSGCRMRAKNRRHRSQVHCEEGLSG